MSARRWLLLALLSLAVTLLVARGLAQIYADFAWYRALGALSVWRARMGTLLLVRTAAGSAATLFAFLNFYAVRQSVISLVMPRRLGNLEISAEVSARRLTATALVLALVVGVVLTGSLDDWSTFLLARVGIPFHEMDPYFSADLGFFVYWLPCESLLFTWVAASVLCVIAVVVLLYVLTPGLRWHEGRLHVSEYVRRHLNVLAGVLVLLLAWHFRLEMYLLLAQGSGPNGAFTFLDHRVIVPGQAVLAIGTLAAGLIVIRAGWTGQRRLAVVAVVGVFAAWLGVRQVVPWIALQAGGDAVAARERPYAATRAGYTRRAYAIDRIGVADSTVAYASLDEAALGVPAWDDNAMARSLEATSRLASGARVGWEGGPFGIVDVIASPQQPPAPGEAAPVGIVIRASASDATNRGAPVRIATATSDDEATLLPPALVLDSARGYLVVSDTGGHVAGVSLTAPLARLAQAFAVQNIRLWFRDLPQPRPTLLTVRGVRERIDALVPFFAQGSEVRPIVLGDSLFWALDLYSASATYPLSRRITLAGDERSYFQHAATALVLSSTGEVRLVADSVVDPVAASWLARFPGLFVRASALPSQLASALPPAVDGARAQALAFGLFGSRADGGAARHPPVLDGADSALAAGQPVYALRHDGPTAIEMPLLDLGERVRGVLVAEGGSSHRIFWAAAQGAPAQWSTVLDRLHAADSLARSSNAAVVHGVVRTFALRNGVGYAQPVYQWSSGGTPSLIHLVVLAGDSVYVAPTLRRIVGVSVVRSRESAPSSSDTERTIRELYQTMRDALQHGDWLAFGHAFDALGVLLARPHS